MGKLGQGAGGTTGRGRTPPVGAVRPGGAAALGLGSPARAARGEGPQLVLASGMLLTPAQIACPSSCLNLCPFSLNPAMVCSLQRRTKRPHCCLCNPPYSVPAPLMEGPSENTAPVTQCRDFNFTIYPVTLKFVHTSFMSCIPWLQQTVALSEQRHEWAPLLKALRRGLSLLLAFNFTAPWRCYIHVQHTRL